MPEDNLIDLFVRNAMKAAADVVVVHSREELEKVVHERLENDNPVYCQGLTEKEKAITIPSERQASNYDSAAVTVEEVVGAVAETGSIICSSHGGRLVQANLLPPHHVAIVSRENIFSDLDEFFASCSTSPPTNITLITGPSRTADIELTLTIGVHGPERLDIVVF